MNWGIPLIAGLFEVGYTFWQYHLINHFYHYI